VTIKTAQKLLVERKGRARFDSVKHRPARGAGAPLGEPFKMSVLRAGKVIELTGTTQ